MAPTIKHGGHLFGNSRLEAEEIYSSLVLCGRVVWCALVWCGDEHLEEGHVPLVLLAHGLVDRHVVLDPRQEILQLHVGVVRTVRLQGRAWGMHGMANEAWQ